MDRLSVYRCTFFFIGARILALVHTRAKKSANNVGAFAKWIRQSQCT